MKSLYSIVFILVSLSLTAQKEYTSIWESVTDDALSASVKNSSRILPQQYTLSSLNVESLNQLIDLNYKKGVRHIALSIPSPTGEMIELVAVETAIMSPVAQDAYSVRSFKGYVKENPQQRVRFSVSDHHAHFHIFADESSFVIDPLKLKNESIYAIYKNADLSTKGLLCKFENTRKKLTQYKKNKKRSSPEALRTFRLAVTTTGEFGQEWGGTPYAASNVIDVIGMGVNLINEVFEKELGITFILVTNEDLVFDNQDTDVFDYDNEDILDQSVALFEEVLGTDAYDIGHCFDWDSNGGVALAEACNASKGAGYSSSVSSLSELFVDFGAHEIGHQIGADHTFAADDCDNSVDGFRYEVSHGSTLMGYADVQCGGIYQVLPDPNFHSESINQINQWLQTNATCFTSSNANLNPSDPIVSAGEDFTIPKETPFVLVGSGSTVDNSGELITFNWEQADGEGDAAGDFPDCQSTDEPLVRVFPPVSENYRIFPQMTEILSGNNTKVDFEQLPCVARTLHFNLTVRDNDMDWGRNVQDQLTLTVADTGPFNVITPNGGETWTEASNTITWSVNGTDQHCPMVDVLLSVDNGNTFEVVASAIQNDGSHELVLAATSGSEARLLIQCATAQSFNTKTTFFDISDAAFSIAIEGTVDADNDGFASDVDCDDNNAMVNPDQAEIPYNGLDDDCNEDTLDDDLDQDGFALEEDCDDMDADINPDAEEIPNNEIDEDCDGEDLATSGTHDLAGSIITIFPNPVADILSIDIDGVLEYQVRLIDTKGRAIYSFKNTKQIDLSSTPSGIYFLEVADLASGKTILEKILKR